MGRPVAACARSVLGEVGAQNRVWGREWARHDKGEELAGSKAPRQEVASQKQGRGWSVPGQGDSGRKGERTSRPGPPPAGPVSPGADGRPLIRLSPVGNPEGLSAPELDRMGFQAPGLLGGKGTRG